MRDFVITADSTVDLPASFYEEKNIRIISLSYLLNDNTYEDLGGLSSKEIMDEIRQGALPTTSQITPQKARDVFEPILKEGKDILHIGFSSALSGSCNSARIAAQELEEEYEDAKIIVVDSLCASMGEGFLLYKAVELLEQGKSLEETAKWVEENKLHICHDFTVDDLFHLYRGGRVSRTTAVIGSMINIKPVLHVDMEGRLTSIGKARGRKKSLLALIDRMGEKSKGYENPITMIVHGDCEEDAKHLAELMKERYGVKDVLINGIGAVIGSHVGPGVIGIFYMGVRE